MLDYIKKNYFLNLLAIFVGVCSNSIIIRIGEFRLVIVSWRFSENCLQFMRDLFNIIGYVLFSCFIIDFIVKFYIKF